MSLRSLLLLLTQRADVYAVDEATGRAGALLTGGLPCRTKRLVRMGDTVTIDRAELLMQRDFYFDPAFVMTERVEIVLDGVRWHPLPGTFTEPGDLSGAVAYRACVIARAA